MTASRLLDGAVLRIRPARIGDRGPLRGRGLQAAEVPFGVLVCGPQGTAYRVARDYLEGVSPIIGRYRAGWGIG